MSTLTYAGTPVEVDPEGFLQRPEQWNEQIAEQIAAEAGIEHLSDRHWLVIRDTRDTYLESGTAPSIRTLGKASGVPIKESYQLFPKGPAKLSGEDRRHPQAAWRRSTTASKGLRVSILGLIMANGDAWGGHRGKRLLHLLRARDQEGKR